MRTLYLTTAVAALLSSALVSEVLLPLAADPSVSWTENSLDLIVKDKHGRPVRDLTATDLVIVDDGKPVRITSLKPARNDPHPTRFVSFLLEGDSDLSRSLAADALSEIAKSHDSSNL